MEKQEDQFISFKDRSASILIIEPLSGVRPIVTAAMRELGFSQIISVESLTESLPVLGAESIDWIIVSIFSEGKLNLLQLLKIMRQESRLRNIKVSFFADVDEQKYLPKAFSLGLFTAHDRPFNKDTFTEEVSEIMRRLEYHHWNPTMVSAEYLRPILIAKKDGHARLRFEQALNAAFPSESAQLINLAEANFELKNHAAARSLLWQAVQRNKKLESKAITLSQRYSEQFGSEGRSAWLNLKLDHCVVVEPDTTIQAGIKEALYSCGAKNIVVFDRGDECWQWLRNNPETDIMIMEWKIPEVSGSMLLQRCRSQGMHLLPIIVHSSLVPKNEEQLLKEMGVNDVIPKPFRPEIFLNCVASTLMKAQRPSDIKDLENQIRSLLASQKIAEATNVLQIYLAKNINADDEGAAILSAEFAFASGDYRTARDIAKNCLKKGNRSVLLMNLLGKSLIRLREFTSALQVLEKANSISPSSIARLCSMTEVKQELGDTQGALETLSQATNFDPENQDVINTNLNIGIVTGDSARVASAIDRFNPNDNILAYLNNSAIVRVKSGKIDSAIELYQKAIEAIPSDKFRLKGIVSYNLALAFVRKNDLESAVIALLDSANSGDEAITKKSRSLNDRVQLAIRNGTSVQLLGETETPAESPSVIKDVAGLLKRFIYKPGSNGDEISCCFGLYFDESLDTKVIVDMLSNLPIIKSKEVIFKGQAAS